MSFHNLYFNQLNTTINKNKYKIKITVQILINKNKNCINSKEVVK
jgi:hypothetical protein